MNGFEDVSIGRLTTFNNNREIAYIKTIKRPCGQKETVLPLLSSLYVLVPHPSWATLWCPGFVSRAWELSVWSLHVVQKFLRLSTGAQVKMMKTVPSAFPKRGWGAKCPGCVSRPPDCCNGDTRNQRHPECVTEAVTEAVTGSRRMEQPIRTVRSALSLTIPHQTVCVLRLSWWRVQGRWAPRHSVTN